MSGPRASLAGVVAIAAIAGVAAQSTATPPAQLETRFRAGIDLVRLSVTARDRSGQIVHDLIPDEFRVSEDGVGQEITHFGHHESPISVVVLFDKSSSMGGEKLMHAKDAVVNFVEALQPRDDALVIAFSDGIDQLGEFGMDVKTITRETKAIRTEGGTRLYDAVLEASAAISAGERKEKRAILILTDGEDTTSRASLDDAVTAIARAEVPVYAIGIEMPGEPPPLGVNPSQRSSSLWRRLRGYGPIDALQRLTQDTGGWTYPIEAAGRCKEVCLLVAEELRNQYLLAYYPSNQTHNGQWRSIRVQVTRPGVTIATRSGYYAPAMSHP